MGRQLCDEALRRHTGSPAAKVGRRSGKEQEGDLGAESLKDSGSLARREVGRRFPQCVSDTCPWPPRSGVFWIPLVSMGENVLGPANVQWLVVPASASWVEGQAERQACR